MRPESENFCPYCGRFKEMVPEVGGGWSYRCPNPQCTSNYKPVWVTANTADTTPPWEKNKDDKANA